LTCYLKTAILLRTFVRHLVSQQKVAIVTPVT